MCAPRVLTLVEWYLPGENAGGPVHSIDALVHRLEGRVHFDVITRDHDFGEPRSYPGIATGVWHDAAPGRRRYLSRREEHPVAVLRLLRRTPHDVLYINTLYSAAFALYPLVFRRLGLLRPRRVVLAPRGQLGSGALALRARRKRAYLAAVRALGLFRGVQWHAASAQEATAIRQLVPDATVDVAAPLRRPTVSSVRPPSPMGTVRIAFVARISEMKNLDFALRILGDCAARIEFDIYGRRENARYWQRCGELLAALPPNVTCSYHGALAHAGVSDVLGSHDLLLLPSLGESFGHVIGEALESGCLALVSDRTPWRGLAAAGAGWDLPLDEPAAFTAAIEEYARRDDAARRIGRIRASAFAARREADCDHLGAAVRMLGGAIAGERA